MNNPTTISDFVVQISARAIGPLFIDKVQQSWNELSPVAAKLSAYKSGSAGGTESLDATAANPRFRLAASILARPDLRIDHRYAGTNADLTAFSACCSRAYGKEPVVVIFPASDKSYIVRMFASASGYLQWWIDLLASKADGSTPNHLTSPVALESMIYILHAVDCYRLVAHQGMLDYAPARDPFIRMSQFAKSMETSIASRDWRWLLPSFLVLTPGLNDFHLNPRLVHLAALLDRGFLIPAKDARNGEEIFYFGPSAEEMGREFMKTWEIGTGFETMVLTGEGPIHLDRAFLAPTILTNHLFRLVPADSGTPVVDHRTMNIDELSVALDRILFAGLDPTVASQVVRRKETPPAVSELRCEECGKVNLSDSKFCSECGRRLPHTVSRATAGKK